MKNIPESIDIILPSRIGDCILTLPALLCLKQLTEKSPERKLKITVFSTNKLTKIIDALDLFEVKQFSYLQKLSTVVYPSDKAIFLHTTTNNLGFLAKKTYGINITGKKITYHVDMPYLHVGNSKLTLPPLLYETLQERYNLSLIAASYFGMLLEIGFSVENILENFKFDVNSLNLKKEITKWKPEIDNYVIVCMEAAYGKKTDADRRYKQDYYFDLAKYIREKYGLKSAFIGIDKKIKIPDNDYCYDFRKKLDFSKLMQFMRYSKAYIGNDTGPLHLVNLVKKQSIGIYAREDTMTNYYPIFKDFNVMSLGFPSLDCIDEFCSKLNFR